MPQTARPFHDPFPSDPGPDAGAARLVTTDGHPLPLRGASLRVEARGGIARVLLSQQFINPLREAMHLTYLLPLPADAAVAGFSFTIGDRRTVGKIARREDAREEFERAILEGRTAGLLEEERSSVFTEELGNVPPHTEVRVEVELDQPLRWLEEGAWEWRFPTVVSPRYASALPVDVAVESLPARAELDLRIGDESTRVESASHAIVVGSTGRVALAESAALDRDVVVAWHVRATEVGARLATTEHGDDTYGLLTLVPPEDPITPVARDLVVLIDASGSMSGAPLAQAVRAVSMLVSTLGDEDRLELIAFASTPTRATREPVACTPTAKGAALAWLARLRASGGTEMRTAIHAALAPLRPDAQRQVVLVTDGHVGFERELVADILAQMPQRTRLHTVGVGSAVNRTLTRWAARAGGGVEILLGLDEDVERAVTRLRVRTTAPLVTDVTITGIRETAAVKLPDLYGGCPALVPVRIGRDARAITIRGTTARGPFERIVPRDGGVGPSAIATLFGRERVDDLETRLAAHGRTPELDAQIEELGLHFGITTRHTSFVAVSDAAMPAGTEARRVTQPQALAYGTSVAGLGLRSALSAMTRGGSANARFAHGAAPSTDLPRIMRRRRLGDSGPTSRLRPGAKGESGHAFVAPAPVVVTLEGPMTVAALARAVVRAPNEVVVALMNLGVPVKSYQTTLDVATARRVATELGHPVDDRSASERRLGTAAVHEVSQGEARARVTEGKLVGDARYRLARDGIVLWSGRVSLRCGGEAARIVELGGDCSVVLEGHTDVRRGDRIECFEREEG